MVVLLVVALCVLTVLGYLFAILADRHWAALAYLLGGTGVLLTIMALSNMKVI